VLRERIRPGLVALVVAVCAATAAGALAAPTPTAPSVTTGSATPLTTRSATITGTVSSDGAQTSYSFEYGTTTSYGAQTGTRTAGPNAANISVSVNLSGLSAGTLYHYALVATNSVGTTTGSDQTFTTLSPPAPAASTGGATAVTGRSATLGGTVNPSGGPTTFYFQYGATSNYGAQTPTRNAGGGNSTLSVSAQLFGLSAGTIYHYRVVATNSAGTTDGSDQTFMTTLSPPPTVVTGSSSSLTPKAEALAGTVTPNGAATTYDFEYGTSTSYGSQTPSRYAGAGSSPEPVTATASGLIAGQVYHFRLVATSSSGTTDGSDQTFTAAPAPAPTVVTGATSSVGNRSATMTGSVTPNGAATSFSFQYGTTTSYGSQTPTRNLGSGGNPLTVMAAPGGLTPGTTYHYRLTATNSGGTTSGSDQTFTTTGPATKHAPIRRTAS
jgi:phosphodiesterase/alkaline phosphatase D-like protein